MILILYRKRKNRGQPAARHPAPHDATKAASRRNPPFCKVKSPLPSPQPRNGASNRSDLNQGHKSASPALADAGDRDSSPGRKKGGGSARGDGEPTRRARKSHSRGVAGVVTWFSE